MTAVLNIVSHSEKETLMLARKLVKTFKSGDLVVLSGELGSGKTVFARGLAEGLGHDENSINSPTYTFVNEYNGEQPLYHFDMYRLKNMSELIEIGWDDYLSKDGLVVVEWGEKIIKMLPEIYYLVSFEIISENEREIKVEFVSKKKS